MNSDPYQYSKALQSDSAVNEYESWSERFPDDVSEELSNYKPVIKSEPVNILGYFPVDPWKFALITMLSDIFGVFFFMISITKHHNRYFSIVALYILSSYIAAPLWQNFYIRSKVNSQEDVSCKYGCILFKGLVNVFNILTGNYDLCARTDDERTDTRFIPFSVYNSVFILMNRGKELNPHLPSNKIDSFGIGRTLLLTYSAAAKGAYNLSVFIITYSM